MSHALPVLAATNAGTAALLTFLAYMAGVFALAILSNRLLQSKSFLSEYFLGSRSLGTWAFALTFAATAASGGSFTGFPSKIYTHGWILALWIGSYMVVPLCGMGFMGKRINQVARISGSITVPDIIRDRFRSPVFATLAVALIVFFISVNLTAQFKSGALILQTLLADVGLFTSTANLLGSATAGIDYLDGVDSQYLLCLLTFGIAVVIYTTYGGFHAVVWTDVMQGIVMVAGVLIMLPLTLWAVGGLENATKSLGEHTPPIVRYASIARDDGAKDRVVKQGTWVRMDARPMRIMEELEFMKGTRELHGIRVLEPTTPSDIDRITDGTAEVAFVDGLRASNPTADDVPIGTLTLLLTTPTEEDRVIERGSRVRGIVDDEPRICELVRDVTIEEQSVRATKVRVRVLPKGDGDVTELPIEAVTNVRVVQASELYGYDNPGTYVFGPGPHESKASGFLPLSLAISFFFMWAISGSGQPQYWVRLMAFDSSNTLRRSMFTVAMYYSMIYLPLVLIFVCARLLLPGMEAEPDRIMPAMAVFITDNAGVGWLAGLLVAAPFAAVMSTVDSVLLVISSALVRDIYQRNMNPEASQKTIKLLSYFFTIVVGTGAMLGAVNPPRFLQDIIVYTGSGLASCFLAFMIYALYWPRCTKQGAMAGMMAGFLAHLSMYVTGIWTNGSFFTPFRPGGMDPILVGLGVSFLAVPIVSLMTPPPPVDLVRKYFCRKVNG